MSFLTVQIRKPDHTRKETARQVAECYGRGSYVSEKIVTWERQWIRTRGIEEGKQGCHTKYQSWFNDEGVQLAVRECISSSGNKLSAQKLAKAVGDYLVSHMVTNTVQEILETELISGENSTQQLPPGLRIRVRTARNWLKRLGLHYHTVSKNVYIDSHERKDVVEYRQHEFLLTWASFERRIVVFSGDGSWTKPPGLREGEKALVLVTHDESIFNANDGKRRENHLYDQKEKEKELWYPNFSPLLEDCASLTLCLIINFFKIKIGLLMKIKNLVDIVLSYLSMVKIITGMETK